MGPDEAANQAQLSGAEAMAAGKFKRFEPELAGLVLPFHMNVRRLAAVEAREEEPIRSRNTSDSRHSKPALPPATQHAAVGQFEPWEINAKIAEKTRENNATARAAPENITSQCNKGRWP
jgi:hypothetical protein